jgi:hypothetical protein
MMANAEQTRARDGGKTLRYAVIGDSYSIGEGATVRESWPALLTRHLTMSVRPVELVSNPARTGWTTQGCNRREFAPFPCGQTGLRDTHDRSKRLGAAGGPSLTFRRRLGHLLDEMLKVLPNEKRLW